MSRSKIDISQLPLPRRIDPFAALWDSLDPDLAAPITPDQAQELERRSADAEADPRAGRSRDEVHAEPKKRLE